MDFSVIPDRIRKSMYEHNEQSKIGMVIEADEAEFLYWYFIKPVLSGYEQIMNIYAANEQTKTKALNEIIAGCIDDFLKIINNPAKLKQYASDLRLFVK